MVAALASLMLLALGFARRERIAVTIRAELKDAPAVFERSTAVDMVLGRDSRRIDCIRSAPPDTYVRALMKQVDSAAFELRSGHQPLTIL